MYKINRGSLKEINLVGIFLEFDGTSVEYTIYIENDA
jgi:hypothetical protein